MNHNFSNQIDSGDVKFELGFYFFIKPKVNGIRNSLGLFECVYLGLKPKSSKISKKNWVKPEIKIKTR